MSSVFIIGNGSSATRHPLGEVIDAADVVVRINDFRTTGFERSVGTKTDILFTCRLNEYLTTLNQFPEVILCLLMNPLEGVTVPEKVLKSPNISARLDWPEVRQLATALEFPGDTYPSTGLLCVLTMIRRFGHVHIVGFDHFEEGNRHYYEEGTRPIPYRHHGAKEADIIRFLSGAGLVTVEPATPKYYPFDGHAANVNPTT